MGEAMEPFTTNCVWCGMSVSPLAYHPFAACMMFRSAKDGSAVEANLRAVVDFGMQAQQCGITIETAMKNIAVVVGNGHKPAKPCSYIKLDGKSRESKILVVLDEIAAEIADYLFVSSRPQETATRLVLERPGHKLEGAGWCREAVRDAIIAKLALFNEKPRRAYKIVSPNKDGNHTERILFALDLLMRQHKSKETTISTAEIDTALKAPWKHVRLGFVASTSTQISKLRAWYQSQGIGTIKRTDERKDGIRICRYWLETAK